MTRVNVKDARSNLKKLLDLVSSGEEVAILRRGKEVARLVPPKRRQVDLAANLRELRRSVRVSGAGLSSTVIKQREGERF